ncbi:hypothetical protein SGPA1_20016 [Streptomyces misionensis JCM 4497]
MRPHRGRPYLRLHRSGRRTHPCAAQQRPLLGDRAPGGLRRRRPGARARPARLLPDRPRPRRPSHPAGRHLAQPVVRRGRAGPAAADAGAPRGPLRDRGPRRQPRSRRPGPPHRRPGRPARRRHPAGPPPPRGRTRRAGPAAAQGARRTGRHRTPVTPRRRRPRQAPRPRDPAGRGARLAEPGPRATGRRRGRGPAAAGAPAADRGRGTAGAAPRRPRRPARPARRRRPGAADRPVGVPSGARPGGAVRGRPAGRHPRRRRPRPRGRRGRTRAVRRPVGAGHRRRTPARRPGAPGTAAGAGRTTGRELANRRGDGGPCAQRLRRVDPAADPVSGQGTWRRARRARLRASTVCGSSRSVPSNSPMRASRL